MKGTLILIAVVALVAAAFKFSTGGPAAAGDGHARAEAAFTVVRGDLQITVSENGYLKAKNSVNISPQFQRQGVIATLVKEGKQVEKDEILCEFEKTEVQNQKDELSSRLVQQRIELEAARADAEIQARESAAAVEKAEFELEVARKKLEMYELGEAPNELRKLNLAVEKARSELARAEETFAKVPELRAAGFFTKNQEELERIGVSEKRIEVENAQKNLELFEIYKKPMDVAERRNAVKDAERGLTNARAKAEIGTKEREGKVRGIEGGVKSMEANIAQLDRELGFMTIKAPRPGILIYGEPGNSWEHDQVKVGNPIYQGNTLFTIPDLTDMLVMSSIHEGDIDLVKVDQRVLITLEAIKNRTFEGKVTRVATVASSRWGMGSGRSFEVEVTMEPVDLELRAGTTAKVEIQVETLKDVLQAPVHAIFAEAGKHYAFLSKGDGYDKREVEIGKHNSHFVELTKGLEAGEHVLLYDPRDSGAATQEPTEETPAKPAATPGQAAAALPGGKS
jgi:HlyD family secretion protein